MHSVRKDRSSAQKGHSIRMCATYYGKSGPNCNRSSARLPVYMSPIPDSQALATDALTADWDHLSAHAFPPFALIRRILNKIRTSNGLTLILIAPWWPAREWFTDLPELCMDHPRHLPSWNSLLKQANSRRFHFALDSLNLHAFYVSSDNSSRKDFRSHLPRKSLAQFDNRRPMFTNARGTIFHSWLVLRKIGRHHVTTPVVNGDQPSTDTN